MKRRAELNLLREYKLIATNPDIPAMKYGRVKASMYVFSAALALFLYRAHIESWVSFNWQLVWAGAVGLTLGIAWCIGYSQPQIHIMSPYIDIKNIEERLNELEK